MSLRHVRARLLREAPRLPRRDCSFWSHRSSPTIRLGPDAKTAPGVRRRAPQSRPEVDRSAGRSSIFPVRPVGDLPGAAGGRLCACRRSRCRGAPSSNPCRPRPGRCRSRGRDRDALLSRRRHVNGRADRRGRPAQRRARAADRALETWSEQRSGGALWRAVKPSVVARLAGFLGPPTARRHADLDSARSPHHDHRQRATNPFEEVIS
jgi:hypothetical protein